MTSTSPESMGEAPVRRLPTLSRLGREVGARVTRLQQQVGRTSTATASLAQLRNSLATEPGTVPAIWEITIAGLPGQQPFSDAPTPEERAAHVAITLYALHQQSRAEPMHQRGVGFGEAVRRLADRHAGTAVRRRFDAVATATSYTEMTHHLRGIVMQLRSAQIPLDYGQLADDLWRFLQPGGDKVVRRRWGRQYYRLLGQPSTEHQVQPSESKDGS